MKHRRLSPEILLHNIFWHSSHTKLDYVWQMPSRAPCVFLLWETESIASYFPSKSLIQVVFQTHSLIFFKSCFLSWQSHADFLASFLDLRPGIETGDCFHKTKRKKMPYVAFLAFCHSSPVPLSSQVSYPNRFSNCDLIFRISGSTLHSVSPFLASCHGQDPVPAWSEGEAMHLKWRCSVRVRQWMVPTGEREEPTSLGLLFNLPIMQLIDFVVVHRQDVPFLVHLLIQVLLLPRSASSFVKHWLLITEILMSLFPHRKD